MWFSGCFSIASDLAALCSSYFLVQPDFILYTFSFFFFLMIRRPPRSTQGVSSAASDVYKRQYQRRVHGMSKIQKQIRYESIQDNEAVIEKIKKVIEKDRCKRKCRNQRNRYGQTEVEIQMRNKQKLSLIHISEPTRPLYISYAVFCLKKKKIYNHTMPNQLQNYILKNTNC
eukprot:TRINITY_DN60404_c0_g1_i1.p1 TRINITY_DN60404_c0_g1~~TRINITY_DN60404_c0_g1_i1.p1  ORF type:complete len:172 (-),score=32.02 TRINITY_DN60404_c0_g1_i1:47-562(-)